MVLEKEEAKRSKEQNRDPEIEPYKYNRLNFDKEAKAIQWRKGKHFNKLC